MALPSPHLFVVILAGGAGTRLWPRSRRDRPKQLIDLFSTRTMLQETFDRVAPLIEADHVYVLTNAGYIAQVRSQLPMIPPDNIIGEAVGRGTAPPIGFAATLLRERDPHATMISLHSDHFIHKDEQFREVIRAGEMFAQQDQLVTLGVVPGYPETGYGYIEAGEELPRIGDAVPRRVLRFTEKPNLETAVRFVHSGNYYWNSGIFIWRAAVILEEFSRHLPRLTSQLEEIAAARGTSAAVTTFERIWSELDPETIDVGIMEKSDRVVVLPLDVGWSDVGNWATLLELLPRDADRNVVIGKHIGVDTGGSLIYSEGRMIATVGLKDMIIVDVGDAVLVCDKKQAQKVKELVDEIKQRQMEEYL